MIQAISIQKDAKVKTHCFAVSEPKTQAKQDERWTLNRSRSCNIGMIWDIKQSRLKRNRRKKGKKSEVIDKTVSRKLHFMRQASTVSNTAPFPAHSSSSPSAAAEAANVP